MKRVAVTGLVVLVSFLTACGGTPGGNSGPPVAEKPVTSSTAQASAKSAATTAISQGKSLSNASSNPSIAASAGLSLGTAGITLVNSVKGQAAAASFTAMSVLQPKAGDCSQGSGYTQNGDTITYDCTYTSTSGSSTVTYSLTGQIVANSSSVTFKNLKIDYAITSGSNSARVIITYNGGFTFTATSVNGKFDISLYGKSTNTSQGNTEASATVSTYYNNVDFAGCSTGAKSGSIVASSSGDGRIYKSGTVKVVFGPNCGDASVYSD
jgi:hypothetical protein